MVIAEITRDIEPWQGKRRIVYRLTIQGKPVIDKPFLNTSECRKVAAKRLKIYPSNQIREAWPGGKRHSVTEAGRVVRVWPDCLCTSASQINSGHGQQCPHRWK